MSSGPTVSSAHDQKGKSFGSAAPDRVSIFLLVRYLTPVLVLLALAASDVAVPRGRLVTLLLAQAAFGLSTQVLAMRFPRILGGAVWTAMLADLAVIGGLSAATGGASSPLVFLFTLEVIAAGILISSFVGLRLLVLSTVAIVALDIVDSTRAIAGQIGIPHGLEAVAALWVLGGSAILFSVSNERELRGRNAELATIRRVTLDIEQTLSLEEILADLCRGVVEAFGFGGAAVLLREQGAFICRSAHGAAGRVGAAVEERGPLHDAVTGGRPLVVPSGEARRDGSLLDVLGPRGYIVVPLGQHGALVATRAGRRGRPGTVRLREIEALTSLAHHAVLALANARLHAEMSEMAVRDPLTGLANHGEFQRVLAHEAGRLERFTTLRAAPGHRLSLLMVDIDRFKALNDRHGHPAGDAVLVEVARAVQDAVRSFDIATRYGGEEFAIVLPETDEEGAIQVAERVRQSVRERVASPSGKRVTVSIGLATAPADGRNPAELIMAADDALYRSKEAGRDRVTTAGALRRRTRAVVALRRPSRRSRGSAARPSAAGSGHARVPSSRPTRRTPRAR